MSEGNLLSEEITQRLLHEIREVLCKLQKAAAGADFGQGDGGQPDTDQRLPFRFGKGRIY